MKPANGRFQAATKVNVLSPEIVVIEKADSIHKLEGNMAMNVTGEFMGTFPVKTIGDKDHWGRPLEGTCQVVSGKKQEVMVDGLLVTGGNRLTCFYRRQNL